MEKIVEDRPIDTVTVIAFFIVGILIGAVLVWVIVSLPSEKPNEECLIEIAKEYCMNNTLQYLDTNIDYGKFSCFKDERQINPYFFQFTVEDYLLCKE